MLGVGHKGVQCGRRTNFAKNCIRNLRVIFSTGEVDHGWSIAEMEFCDEGSKVWRRRIGMSLLWIIGALPDKPLLGSGAGDFSLYWRTLGRLRTRNRRRTRMSFWTQLRMPTDMSSWSASTILPATCVTRRRPRPQDLLATMAGYFARTGQIVGDAGGRLIKTLGDAGLVAFPAEAADAGVLALLIRAIHGSRVAWPARLQDHHRRQAAPGTRRDRPGRQPGRGPPGRLRQDGERRCLLAQHRARRHAGSVPQPAGRDPQALQEAHAADQLH